jgi:hypothetical protein
MIIATTTAPKKIEGVVKPTATSLSSASVDPRCLQEINGSQHRLESSCIVHWFDHRSGEKRGLIICEERLNTQDGFSHAFVEVVRRPYASWPHHVSLRMLRILPK